jgi:hypothetical protein
MNVLSCMPQNQSGIIYHSTGEVKYTIGGQTRFQEKNWNSTTAIHNWNSKATAIHYRRTWCLCTLLRTRYYHYSLQSIEDGGNVNIGINVILSVHDVFAGLSIKHYQNKLFFR